MTSNLFKYYHFTLLRDSNLSKNISLPYQKYQIKRLQSFKIRIKSKLIYIIEIYYFDEYAFIKFHPKLHENNPLKYQIVNIGLSIEEIKKLLNTCCKIILNQIDKSENSEIIYSFFGQWYDKDNLKKRLITKRFNLYKKQVTTFFSYENFWHDNEEIINFYCISPKQNSKFNKQVKKLRTILSNDLELTQQFMTEEAKEIYLK